MRWRGEPLSAASLRGEGLAASRLLKERREGIAERVVQRVFEARPELLERFFGAREKCVEDHCHHLDYLGEALAFARPGLFTEYAVWVATLREPFPLPVEVLALSLQLLRGVLASELSGAGGELASQCLDAALAKLEEPRPAAEGYLQGDGALDILARDYLAALLHGRRETASHLVLTASESGIPIQDLYLQVFARVQNEVGRLWQSNRIGVAQEHYCTACTQLIMAQLYPRIFSGEKNGGRLVAACVGGDLHEIGLRMVTDFFELEGWDTYFLGANTPLSGTLEQLAMRRPHVLAISATLSFHLQAVAELIAAIRATSNPPRILVGGRPFNTEPGLWRDVDADAGARDAAEALTVAAGWRP